MARRFTNLKKLESGYSHREHRAKSACRKLSKKDRALRARYKRRLEELAKHG